MKNGKLVYCVSNWWMTKTNIFTCEKWHNDKVIWGRTGNSDNKIKQWCRMVSDESNTQQHNKNIHSFMYKTLGEVLTRYIWKAADILTEKAKVKNKKIVNR